MTELPLPRGNFGKGWSTSLVTVHRKCYKSHVNDNHHLHYQIYRE